MGVSLASVAYSCSCSGSKGSCTGNHDSQESADASVKRNCSSGKEDCKTR
ncbi:hypothetical protein [Aquimarina megaterium]|nr:hypothetical protein [Aquimarina megaterium]